MALVTIKHLESFVQVADLGSFRRAAEVLGTTQPNISTRIAGLEAQLGVRLFERDAGSVRLTPTGATLLPKARAVLAGVEGFIRAADDDTLFEGVLRLGVTEMIVHSWLGTYLAALRDRFPNVDIDLTVDFSERLSEGLFTRALDLTLQNGPFNRQATGMVDLGVYPMTWVAAPSLGLGRGAVTLPNLAAHPILTHARGTLPFDQISDHIAGRDDVQARLVPSTNITACIQMTLQGLGVACLPAIMVRPELQAGRLEPVAYEWCPDALSFHARHDANTAPHYVAEAAQLAAQVAEGER